MGSIQRKSCKESFEERAASRGSEHLITRWRDASDRVCVAGCWIACVEEATQQVSLCQVN